MAESDDRYDLDVFIDPLCPFCWVTSRWVVNVSEQREYTVRWRSISLAFINESKDIPEEYRVGARAGLAGLRILDAIREQEGNEAVGKAYTAFGNQIHATGRRDDLMSDAQSFYAGCLVDAGYSEADAKGLAAHAADESHDPGIRADGDLGFERTGPDVGTPILTFDPDGDSARSLFGPVISKAPTGDDALRLWDAVETLARSGVAEIKRSLRDPLDFS